MLVNEERVIARFEQQPWERKRYRVDFRQHLAPGETVSIPSFLATPETVPPVVVDAIAIAPEGNQLILFISGGVDATTYRLRMRTVTSDGQNLEDEIDVRIREA